VRRGLQAPGEAGGDLAAGEVDLANSGARDLAEVEDCVGDITVWGEFQTLTANAWDLPARKARISSKPFLIGKR
jgi:hypothetical protein